MMRLLKPGRAFPAPLFPLPVRTIDVRCAQRGFDIFQFDAACLPTAPANETAGRRFSAIKMVAIVFRSRRSRFSTRFPRPISWHSAPAPLSRSLAGIGRLSSGCCARASMVARPGRGTVKRDINSNSTMRRSNPAPSKNPLSTFVTRGVRQDRGRIGSPAAHHVVPWPAGW